MNIRTKYSVGDKVLAPVDKMIIKVCPFCNGERIKRVDGVKLYCQNCDDGYTRTRSDERVYVPATIKDIMINIRPIDDWEEYDDYRSDITGDNKTIGLIEYYIRLDDEDHYWSNGTYKEERLRDFEPQDTSQE